MRKTNRIITLIASFVISTSALAGAPKAELVKAEPAQKTNLAVVQESLTISLATLKLDTDFSLPVKNNSFAVRKQQQQRNKIVQVTSSEVAAD